MTVCLFNERLKRQSSCPTACFVFRLTICIFTEPVKKKVHELCRFGGADHRSSPASSGGVSERRCNLQRSHWMSPFSYHNLQMLHNLTFKFNLGRHKVAPAPLSQLFKHPAKQRSSPPRSPSGLIPLNLALTNRGGGGGRGRLKKEREG